MSIRACAALVDAGDPDRFAATMAAPVAVRARLWPLYAFNLEIARAPWASSEPLVAEMRLQWWIDTVEAMGQGTGRPGHDVTDALAPLVAGTKGLGPLLSAMAEARRWEVWQEPFADENALKMHIVQTAGNLMWAAAKVLGAPEAAEAPVRDIGFAAGLASWLRAVPALASHGRQPLPDPSPAAIARLARDGLAALARAKGQPIARAAIPALWPGWQARGVLTLAASDPERVADGGLQLPEFRKRWGLMWRSLSGGW